MRNEIMFNCSNCGKSCSNKHNLHIHQIFRHGKLTPTDHKVLFYSLIIAFVFFVIAPLTNNYISMCWDKMRGIEPELYLSLHHVFVARSETLLNLSESSARVNFLEDMIESYKKEGVVPLPIQNAAVFNVVDGKTGAKACMFSFFEVPQQTEKTVFMIPDFELITESCIGCLPNVVFAVNKGTKTVESVNFHVVFNDEIYVEKNMINNDIEICGAHCIRLKETLITSEEEIISSFIVKKYDNNIYDDTMVKEFNAYYTTWGIEHELQESHVNEVKSLLFLNCTTI